MNSSLLLLVPVLAIPAAHGLSRAPLWTLFVVPGLAQGFGYYGVVTEPSNYDMHGFTLVLTLMAGAMWLGVSLLARLVRVAWSAYRH